MNFVTVDRRGRLTLSEEARRQLGLRSDDSDILMLEVTDHGTIELIPAALVPRDQLWLHHPEMRARLAEAEADFRAGRFVETDTPDAAQAYLDSLKKPG